MYSLRHEDSSLSLVVFSASFNFTLIRHGYPLDLLETFDWWSVRIVCVQFSPILSLTNRIFENLVPVNPLNIVVWCNSTTFTESILRRFQVMPNILVYVLRRVVAILLPTTTAVFSRISVSIPVQNFLKLLKSFLDLSLFQNLRQATIFVVLLVGLSILLLILSF